MFCRRSRATGKPGRLRRVETLANRKRYYSAICIGWRCFTEGPGRLESPVDSAESKPLQIRKRYYSAICIGWRCFTEGPGRPESPVDSAESKPLQNRKLFLNQLNSSLFLLFFLWLLLFLLICLFFDTRCL